MRSCSSEACAPIIVAGSSGLPPLMALTRSSTRARNGSAIDSWTSARDGQVQTSPWLRANITKPSTALSRKSSSASITSARKMLGLLPPSSRVTGMRFSEA